LYSEKFLQSNANTQKYIPTNFPTNILALIASSYTCMLISSYVTPSVNTAIPKKPLLNPSILEATNDG